MHMMSTDRRGLLKGGAAATASLGLAAPFAAMMESAARAQTNGRGEQTALVASPYGPIRPVRDRTTGLFLLQLPRGFTYRTFHYRGDLMTDGQRVPAAHDGMAVVNMVGRGGSEAHLILNHEMTNGTLIDVPNGVWDRSANANGQQLGGSCTAIKVRNGQLVSSAGVIGGLVRPCAGGRTLWNTWITNEETLSNFEASPRNGKKHGYNFDVPVEPALANATPLIAMGRFSHEACASDPTTGYIYETEDARNVAAFYRFKPNNMSRTYGSLADGGTLQAAKVVGVEKANLLALRGPLGSTVEKVGDSFEIEWVTVPNPDADPANYADVSADNPDTATRFASGPYIQAREAGALRMSRGEGIWWDHTAQQFVIADTSFGYDGTNRAGQGFGGIWTYKPSRANPDRGTLTLISSGNNIVAMNNPDNITISPKGGILYCDDGDDVEDEFGIGQRLIGLRADGLGYAFAKSNVIFSAADLARIGRTGQFEPGDYRGAEWAGATWDWSGRVLYVNNYTPGIVFAISGPWALGNLG
jgi:hypothetical protein